MRIGVDAGCWANDRGYGRLARQLLPVLVRIAKDDGLVFYVDSESRPRVDVALAVIHETGARGAS